MKFAAFFDRQNLMAYAKDSELPYDEGEAKKAFELMDSGSVICLTDSNGPVSSMYLDSNQGYVEEILLWHMLKPI